MDTSYHQQLLEHTGKRIRFYRRLKKLSQDELAIAIHKSESTLSKYERGTIAIDIATLHDIAGVLDVSISDLVDYNIPAPQKKSTGTGLFGNKDILHLYYYEKYTKKFQYGIIHLDYSDESTEVPCRCYLEIPESGNHEECRYYSTGNMLCYDSLSYISLKSSTMKMDHLYFYIMNPYTHNANAWGFLSGPAFNGTSIYIYKVLISPERIPISELNVEDFAFSSDDAKDLRQRNFLRFNHPYKDLV